MQRYFEHVDRSLDLRRDCYFNTPVLAARFDKGKSMWRVTTEGGSMFSARFLLMNTGSSSKPYIPSIKGLESFQGPCLHPSLWPQDGLDMSGKRVAIIGTGASGVQLIQEAGKVAKQLAVFQRTPNFAMPMTQVQYDSKDQPYPKSMYLELFQRGAEDLFGVLSNPLDRKTTDDTYEERMETYKNSGTKRTINSSSAHTRIFSSTKEPTQRSTNSGEPTSNLVSRTHSRAKPSPPRSSLTTLAQSASP